MARKTLDVLTETTALQTGDILYVRRGTSDFKIKKENLPSGGAGISITDPLNSINDGVSHTITGSEVYDDESAFASSAYTAPRAGIYLLAVHFNNASYDAPCVVFFQVLKNAVVVIERRVPLLSSGQSVGLIESLKLAADDVLVFKLSPQGSEIELTDLTLKIHRLG